MALQTFGGNPSAVLTTKTGDTVPDYPVLVRAAGTGAIITALFEDDGVTPIDQLRTNGASSDLPGAIRTFKIPDQLAITYEYNGPSGQPVRWWEASREASTAALEGLASKLDKSGGQVTGDLDVLGKVDATEILEDGQPISGLNGAGIFLPARYGAVGNGTRDDAPAVQAALDAAFNAGGGWVIVPPGIYLAATLPLRIRRGTRLTLMAGATIRRGANGTMLLNGTADQTFGGYTGHGGIIIEGGVWDARAAQFPTSAMCISLGHAEGVTVRDTVIKDVCGYHGIEMNSIKRGRMINVAALGYLDPDGTRNFSEAFQLDLAKGSAYFGGFGPYDDTECVDILVQGCSVGPSGTAGTTSWPRAVGSHSASPGRPHKDVRIRDLRAEGCAQFAVGGYTWQDVIISGLQLRNCGAGVRIRTLDSSTTSHRTPAGGSSATITGSQPLTNIVIDDVTMTGGGAYDAAVRVEGEDTGYVGGVAIGRITTRGITSQALRLVDVEDYTVSDVVAYNSGATAVSQLGTRRGRLRNVHVNGATGAGITLDSRSTPAASATDVTIAGCSVTGVTANGVHIWDGTDVLIDDVDLYALTGYGVQISTNTARPVLRNIRTRDTTLAGVNITSSVTGVQRHGNTLNSVADASTTPSETSPFDSGAGSLEDALRPAGRWETTSRIRAGGETQPSSGYLYLVPVWLPKGVALSNITFISGNTAAGTPTNCWFTLHDRNRVAVARTGNATTTAWAANTARTLAIAQTTAGNATTYTTTYTGLHYLGIMATATTMPSLVAEGRLLAGADTSPGLGVTNSGQTTPPTVTAGAFTAASFGSAAILAYGYAA